RKRRYVKPGLRREHGGTLSVRRATHRARPGRGVVYNRAVLLFTNDSEALSPGVPLPRGCRATTPSRSTPWDGLARISQMIASERDADVRIGYELQGFGDHGGERWMGATTGEAEGTGLRVAFDRR